MNMPNVDMPILEAPVQTTSSLDQQEEDFFRELSSYDYDKTTSENSKADGSFSNGDNYSNFNGQFGSRKDNEIRPKNKRRHLLCGGAKLESYIIVKKCNIARHVL
jgi:hypothetical protein